MSFLLLLHILCARGALASDVASTHYSSLIRTISRSKVLWQWSQGTCHSAMLINMSSSEPLWQLLPVGSSESQDFSQALLWGPNLFYSLRREPALTALGTRCGIEAFQWPRQSPLLLRWLRPRALDLPRGSRLVGPTPMGDRVALHSQGTAPGASSHLYAVHAANGTLAWQADVAALVSEGQLPQPLTDMVITDVLFDFPGLMITASLHQPLPAKGNGNVTDDHDWGLAAEWLTNGTLRWASDALVPAPIRVAGSTELMAIAVSAPDRDRDTTLFGLSRESGSLAWSSACTGSCLLQVIDTDTLLIHEEPSSLDGLRAVDIGSGVAVWRLPKPRLRPLSCGATVLTSSDLVVACECSATKDAAVLALGGDGTEGLAEMGEEEPRKSLCVYSVRPTDGKLQWEAVVASGAGGSGDDAGLLPLGALAYGQRPTVLAESLVVALRHSVVSVQRRPSLLPGPDGRKAGEVLWHLQLPAAYVVDGWATLTLHAGVLLLQVSRDDAGGSNASAAPRILFALNPSTGQVVWEAPLGPSLPPPSKQTFPWVFSPGQILMDRCSSDTDGTSANKSLRGPQQQQQQLQELWKAAGSSGGISARSRMGGPDSRTAIADPGGLLSSPHQGDVVCCLDALDEVTGRLLWSRCANQGQACRNGEAQDVVETVVDVLLVLQALAVLAGLGSVLAYRVWWQPNF